MMIVWGEARSKWARGVLRKRETYLERSNEALVESITVGEIK